MTYNISKGDVVVLPAIKGCRDYVIGVAEMDYVGSYSCGKRIKMRVGAEVVEYDAYDAQKAIDFLHDKDRRMADLESKIDLLSRILGMAGKRVVTEAEAARLGLINK